MALITITKTMGSSGAYIAGMVAKDLNIPLYDDLGLQAEAVKMGMAKDDLKSLNEKNPGFFELLWSSRPMAYLDLMEAVVYEVAGRGQGVIVGHGSPFLLRNFDCALHVLVHGSDAYRLKNVMESKGLSRDVAEKMLRKSDHERKGFMRFAFHMDWNDLALYDLVINPAMIEPEGAAAVIMEAARLQKVTECSLSARDAMESMALIKKIEGALLEKEINLRAVRIDSPEKGVAVIEGFTFSDEIKKQILEIAKNIPDVRELRDALTVVRHSLS